jgi:lysophospholipase L1-like esterase
MWKTLGRHFLTVFFATLWLATGWYGYRLARQNAAAKWQAKAIPASKRVATPLTAAGGAGAGVKVGWLLGDSRVHRWPVDLLPSGCQWENIGRDDDTAAEAETWLAKNLARSGAPDFIVLQAGVNDVKAAAFHPEEKATYLAQARESLTGLVQTVAQLAPECRLIFTTILPRGPLELKYRLLWTEAEDAAIDELNHHIRSLSGEKVRVLESFAALETERYLRAADAADTLHLSRQGYAKLAKAVADKIRD